MSDIHELGVTELGRAYHDGRLTPVTVCEYLLARIGDDTINCNAFAYVDGDAALEAAASATRRWRDGQPLSPLDGIPVGIKDVLDVAGMPTRFGSAACEQVTAAAADSLVAQRLRAAGAVILGKTRTWEFAWRSNPRRDAAQVVRNPCDQQRSPGGSSSGSAAAVAAGLCPIAVGTDSGGSVRGPAAFCGIVGLKPSHALIPVYPPSPMGDLEHVGLLARSVADVRTTLEQVGGRHRDDPASWPFSTALGCSLERMQSLRFGASVDLNYADPPAAMRDLFAGTLTALRECGLVIDDLDLSLGEDFERCYELFIPDAALTVDLAPVKYRERVDPQILALAQQADCMTVREYAALEAVRDEIRRSFAHLFENIDCLLTLTQETVANPLDELPGIMRLTRCFNLTGQPAISIPCGTAASGLPIGLQLVCDIGNDGLLLAIAEGIAAELASA